jgi:hypothetical protein
MFILRQFHPSTINTLKVGLNNPSNRPIGDKKVPNGIFDASPSYFALKQTKTKMDTRLTWKEWSKLSDEEKAMVPLLLRPEGFQEIKKPRKKRIPNSTAAVVSTVASVSKNEITPTKKSNPLLRFLIIFGVGWLLYAGFTALTSYEGDDLEAETTRAKLEVQKYIDHTQNDDNTYTGIEFGNLEEVNSKDPDQYRAVNQSGLGLRAAYKIRHKYRANDANGNQVVSDDVFYLN